MTAALVAGPPARADLPPSAAPSRAHARAFAPPGDARFEFFVTPETIDAVARFFRERSPAGNPGSWEIARAPAAEAFDAAALFDRSRLARLYGGRSPRVARGPAAGDDGDWVVLLLSPYPAEDLSRLEPGTLIMRVRNLPEP